MNVRIKALLETPKQLSHLVLKSWMLNKSVCVILTRLVATSVKEGIETGRVFPPLVKDATSP